MKNKAHNPFAVSVARTDIFASQKQAAKDDNADLGECAVDDAIAELEGRQEWFVAHINDEWAENELLFQAAEDWAEEEEMGEKQPGLSLAVFISPKRKNAKPAAILRFSITAPYSQVCKRVKAYAKRKGVAIKRVKWADWGCGESWARRSPGHGAYSAGILITPEKTGAE
ncbi:MAG: hypothetical protein ACR2P4_02330 [Gammaproteobacteria bacterium]